jgi:DNA-binding transcriptional ArsR family regulator
MATRWEVTKAVRTSDLPAASRLVMLTLADSAETGTAEIPPRFTPSLSVLADETGLDRSTVKRHLAALEKGGWIVRSRPSPAAQRLGERTRYRLDLPRGVERPPVGAEDAGVGAEDAQGGRTEPPGVGAQNTRGRRTMRHQESDHSDQSQIRVRSPVVADRLDVERVCKHLADRIEENGSKRPTITQGWRDAARRLIDRDGKSVDQILKAIDWSQSDEFWKANILSLPKLREQYDRLRLAAQRPQPRASPPDRRIVTGPHCPRHRGQPEDNCALCRSEALAAP